MMLQILVSISLDIADILDRPSNHALKHALQNDTEGYSSTTPMFMIKTQEVGLLAEKQSFRASLRNMYQ